MNNVSAMPTFKFYKQGKVIEEIRGANPAKLESTVRKWSEQVRIIII